jgi:GTP-binding protein SAR1
MSFIYSSLSRFFNNLLSSLGFLHKEASLLLLGLDNAGKTTLLHRLATGHVRPFPPTDRPRQDAFQIGGVQFAAWDLGGHEAVRHLWCDYCPQVSAVFFIIDANDNERLEEAGYELDALIGEQILAGLPIAILLNKCDLETAVTTQHVCETIDYERLRHVQGKERMGMFRISVLTGEGYTDAFRWVSDNFI